MPLPQPTFSRHLSVRLNGRPAARLSNVSDGRLQLSYLDDWLSDTAAAYPLSLSLPLQEEPHSGTSVEAFFGGLLPDSTQHRKRIAEIFHVSAGNDFSLLEAIGRDCPGAVTVLPEDAPIVLEDDIPEQFEPLDERQLADLIRALPVRPLAIDEELRLSLAGVNDKAALLVKGKTIGLAHGGYPTSHILKTDIGKLTDSIRTEFFSLQIAAAAGIKTPAAAIRTAEDQHYMLMARYDRVRVPIGGGEYRIRRVHQEDFCQALGRPPQAKYEKTEGGPNWAAAFSLMTATEEPVSARQELLRRALFQYLIANPDAHAKNYSLLHTKGHRLRLAPFYDVNNAPVFWEHFSKVKPSLAMSVGGEFDPTKLTGSHWDRFAQSIGQTAGSVRRQLQELAAELPDLAAGVRDLQRGTPSWSPLFDRIVDDLAQRCADVPTMLSKTENAAPSPPRGPTLGM